MADDHELDVPDASTLGKLVDPNAPGVTDRSKVQRTIKELKEICFRLANADINLRRNERFPGSHPVSLTREFLHSVLTPEADRYVVCEKTDGVRYLLLMLAPKRKTPSGCDVGGCYLIDRKYTFTKVDHIFVLPNREKRSWKKGYQEPCPFGVSPEKNRSISTTMVHNETLLDGELVVDKMPDGSRKVLYLAYDILAENSVSLLDLNLEDRLLAIQSRVILPHRAYKKLMIENNRAEKVNFSFDIGLKQMYRCRNVPFVLNTVLPRLRHGNDGLIFTPIDEPYKAGTDEKVFKWKPPHLNSVDFELNSQRGYFKINIYDRETPVHHDWITVTEKFRQEHLSTHSLPVIVECVYDRTLETVIPDTESWNQAKQTTRMGGWKIMRLRDDKNRPNEKRILDKIMISIQDALLEKDLVSQLTNKEYVSTSPPQKKRQRVSAPAPAGSSVESAPVGFREVQNTLGRVFFDQGAKQVKYFQDANKKWPFWTNMKGFKYLKMLCKKTTKLLNRNMEIIQTSHSGAQEASVAVRNGRKLYEDKPTWHTTKRLGVHGDGQFVTWSQQEYGMPGLQRTYLEMKSFQRFTEMWSLLERANICRLFDDIAGAASLRVCSMGGGPGFELVAFQQFLKDIVKFKKKVDIISADLEETWGEYVRLLGFDFIQYNVKACDLLERCSAPSKGPVDFILVSAVMEMYMSNDTCADHLERMLKSGGVRAVLVVSRSKKLSAHRLMERRGIRVVPLLPNGDERLSMLLSPNIAGRFQPGLLNKCLTHRPVFPNVPYLD